VLARGHASRRGTQHELFERGGLCAALYQRQLRTGTPENPDLALVAE
jgi:hypothetical protein